MWQVTVFGSGPAIFFEPFLNWEEPVRGARFFLQLRLSLAAGLQERRADAKERFIESAVTLRRSGVETAPESAPSSINSVRRT